MSRRYFGYHNLLAVRKSTTYGAILDCWVVPADFSGGGLGVYLHDDSVIYNCRSFTGGGNNYDTTAEFKSAEEAYDDAVAYCRSYGYVYTFALSDDTCYNLDGSSTDNKSHVMEFA